MNKAAFLIPFLAVLPAFAQDYAVSVSYGQLDSTAQTIGGSSSLMGTTSNDQFTDQTLGAFGVHFAWSALSLGPVALELTAAYQAPATKDIPDTYWLTLSGGPYDFGTATRTAQLRDTYAGVGARVTGRVFFDWSLGVEYRVESLRLTPDAAATSTATLTATLDRAWLGGSLGYTFPSFELKPFLAVSWATALTKVDSDGLYDTKLVRSMAPKVELAVQAGIRF